MCRLPVGDHERGMGRASSGDSLPCLVIWAFPDDYVRWQDRPSFQMLHDRLIEARISLAVQEAVNAVNGMERDPQAELGALWRNETRAKARAEMRAELATAQAQIADADAATGALMRRLDERQEELQAERAKAAAADQKAIDLNFRAMQAEALAAESQALAAERQEELTVLREEMAQLRAREEHLQRAEEHHSFVPSVGSSCATPGALSPVGGALSAGGGLSPMEGAAKAAPAPRRLAPIGAAPAAGASGAAEAKLKVHIPLRAISCTAACQLSCGDSKHHGVSCSKHHRWLSSGPVCVAGAAKGQDQGADGREERVHIQGPPRCSHAVPHAQERRYTMVHRKITAC